jgi:hypothetical protein
MEEGTEGTGSDEEKGASCGGRRLDTFF